MSAAAGAKGHRYYDWALVRLDHHGPAPAGQAGRHWRMVRRNRTTGELAFYRCHTSGPTPLAVLVKVAGRRWRVITARSVPTCCSVGATCKNRVVTINKQGKLWRGEDFAADLVTVRRWTARAGGPDAPS